MAVVMESSLPVENFAELGPEWLDSEQNKFMEEVNTRPKFYLTFKEDGFEEGIITLIMTDDDNLSFLTVTAPEDALLGGIEWVKDNNPHLEFGTESIFYEESGDAVKNRKSAKLSFV